MKLKIIALLILFLTFQSCDRLERLNLIGTPREITNLTTNTSVWLETQIIDLEGNPERFGYTWEKAPDLPNALASPVIIKDAFVKPGLRRDRITGLDDSTSYNIRAFVIFNDKVQHSEPVLITTKLGLSNEVIVLNGPISEISQGQAIAKGEVQNNSLKNIEYYGHCWSDIALLPGTNDSCTCIKNITLVQGKFPVPSTLTNLKPSTKYYIRAYVKLQGQNNPTFSLFGSGEFVTGQN